MMRPFHPVAPSPASPAAQRPAASKALSGGTMLFSPSPNPIQVGATMRFTLRVAGQAELDLYDVAGHHVRQLASGSFPAGEQALRWDGTDDRGKTVASGVYLLNLRADGVTRTMKVSFMP
jgi:flagellar hook capping protein FlgD